MGLSRVGFLLLFLATLAALAGPVACGAQPDLATPDAASVEASPPLPEGSAEEAGVLSPFAPLGGEWLEPLADDRGEVGSIALPIGTRSKRPVVVALHGALDDPARSCSEWRAVFGPEPFIVCPHGDAVGPGAYVWGDPARMRAAIDRAVLAAVQAYGDRVDVSAAVWASYSQGGILAPETLAHPGIPFRYAVLLEGVPKSERGLRAAFERAGIRRALFVNQQPGWSGAHAAAARAVGPGIEAKHVFIGPSGHFIRGETLERLRAAVPWLVAGDAAWGPFPP